MKTLGLLILLAYAIYFAYSLWKSHRGQGPGLPRR